MNTTPDHTSPELRVAVCQLSATPEKDHSLKMMEPWVRRAHEQSADLVLLPEYLMYMPAELSTAIWDQAEDLDGPFVAEVKRLACLYSTTILCNIVERRSGDRKPYNTQVAVNPAGEMVGVYRKVHLYDAHGYRESDFFSAGEDLHPSLIDVNGWSVALLICYDLRFPEGALVAAEAGADLVTYATAFVPGPRKEDQWTTLIRARAIENGLFVAGGVQAVPEAIGGSLIVDPMGAIEGDAGAEEALLVRRLDKAKIARTRAQNPVLDNRVYRVPVDLSEG